MHIPRRRGEDKIHKRGRNQYPIQHEYHVSGTWIELVNNKEQYGCGHKWNKKASGKIERQTPHNVLAHNWYRNFRILSGDRNAPQNVLKKIISSEPVYERFRPQDYTMAQHRRVMSLISSGLTKARPRIAASALAAFSIHTAALVDAPS